MGTISLDIEKVGYSGEFNFKATLDTVICKVSCYNDTNLDKDFSANILSCQILTGDIQAIVK